MAGHVDEMTASQYTKGHPIPRFALKDKDLSAEVGIGNKVKII
jgi:hypothetical protein